MEALNRINDFYMELKWDFQSWGKALAAFLLFYTIVCCCLVPLVSRILPSDICKIYKSGANIRLDTTLVDFSDMRWERGDISFIFNGDAKPNESLTVLDNITKVYQKVRYEVRLLSILILPLVYQMGPLLLGEWDGDRGRGGFVDVHGYPSCTNFHEEHFICEGSERVDI